jgi:cholesterol transport system auxiliary component
LASALAEAVRASGSFEFVLTPGQRTRSDYMLGGEVSRFEHLPTASPPRVAVGFTLSLMRSSDRRSLMSRRYAGEEPTNGSSPDAMVEAFNRLTGRLLMQALEDLNSLPRKG